jgi:hypothetical protein
MTSQSRPLNVLHRTSPEHPFWHLCRKCATWAKVLAVSLTINFAEDFATFKPFHAFYEHMGWIK